MRMIQYGCFVTVILISLGCYRSNEASDQADSHAPLPTAWREDADLTRTEAGKVGKSVNRKKTFVVKDSVVFKFESFVIASTEQGRAAQFLVTNGYAKDIQSVQLRLEYLDQGGNKVGRFGWGSGPNRGKGPWCKAGETILFVGGASIPEKVKEVRVSVKKITFEDGTEISF